MRKAVFPGSFDPLTLGHCEIIKKASNVFDEVIIAVGSNIEKKYQYGYDRCEKLSDNCEYGRFR